MQLQLLLIALGGAAGSVLRHLVQLAVTAPLGTLVVNVAGSFAMGVLVIVLAGRALVSPMLLTGLLGGFTTFSAFSLDAVRLWEAGQATQALLYALTSVGLSCAALAAGLALARGWAA